MILSDKEILYASLVGSKLAKQLPRFDAVENQAMKHVLPPTHFLPFKNKVQVEDVQSSVRSNNWQADASNVSGQFFPLSFRQRKENASWYTLPYEPLITIGGGNDIIKRKVAKAPNFIGTVKEHWAQNDYSITITGVLFGEQMFGSLQDTFPRADFEKLRDFMTDPQGIEVRCEPLQLLGINYLVVDDFTFPFSKGENVQAYSITCSSDFSPEFLLEIPD